MSVPDVVWRWTIGEDVEAIHRLLCESDAYTATSAAPAPRRSQESTRRYVEERAVHLLYASHEMAASITVTWHPPFAHDLAAFPPADRPAYITRLSVSPAWAARDALLGARCLRHAADVAASNGADALRSEANPYLRSMQLLQLSGFIECAHGLTDGRAWSLLQKPLPMTRSSSA